MIAVGVLLVAATLAGRARAGAGGDDLLRALALLPEGELIRFAPHRVGAAVQLELAARVRAPAARVIALLADPMAYRRAVPSFVRAETVRSVMVGEGGRPERLLDWELEIPLWNLRGRLWLRPRADGAVLELAEGDLTPGRFSLSVAAAEGGGCTLLMQGGANLRNASWITRRLAARHAHAEPAMAVAAAYVLLRALVLEAERGAAAGPPGARWPRSPPRAPEPGELDGGGMAAVLAAARPLVAGAALAAVQSRPDGRLRSAQLAVRPRVPAERLRSALALPATWQALPGWHDVTARPAPGGGAGRVVWEVDAWLPFVDFDAQWWVTPLPRFRAVARGGDWQGAVLGWDLLPAEGEPAACLAVFSSHPRVDQTGYLPRKLIDAEPLLEHGLALGLGYVNALSLLDALSADH